MTHVIRRIRLAAIAALLASAGCGDGAVAPSDLPDSQAADAAQHDNRPTIRWTMTFSSRLEVGKTMRIGARYYRSEEHTSELQSLMRISYAVFCLKKKTYIT